MISTRARLPFFRGMCVRCLFFNVGTCTPRHVFQRARSPARRPPSHSSHKIIHASQRDKFPRCLGDIGVLFASFSVSFHKKSHHLWAPTYAFAGWVPMQPHLAPTSSLVASQEKKKNRKMKRWKKNRERGREEEEEDVKTGKGGRSDRAGASSLFPKSLRHHSLRGQDRQGDAVEEFF